MTPEDQQAINDALDALMEQLIAHGPDPAIDVTYSRTHVTIRISRAPETDGTLW